MELNMQLFTVKTIFGWVFISATQSLTPPLKGKDALATLTGFKMSAYSTEKRHSPSKVNKSSLWNEG